MAKKMNAGFAAYLANKKAGKTIPVAPVAKKRRKVKQVVMGSKTKTAMRPKLSTSALKKMGLK